AALRPEGAVPVGSASDWRLLRAAPDVHARAARQPLPNPARESEAPLGWLVRVGGGADDDWGGRTVCRTEGPKVATQVAFECDQQLLLHEHPFLERLPPVRSAERQKLLVREFSRVGGRLG